MEKIVIGIPSYGAQSPAWWSRLVLLVGTLPKQGVDFRGLTCTSSMLTDKNRNMIVESFLRTDADWLFWLDADTVPPVGGIRRLLDTGKSLVSGLYYLRSKPFTPVAYLRQSDNRYRPLSEWERGEIVPVDAAGMGCCLVHRSVYEEIKNKYEVLQRHTGGLTAVHRDDILGRVPESPTRKQRKRDGQVLNGVLQERLVPPTAEVPFPFFVLEHNRTEDLWFYEIAARVGCKAWVDTSVECGHVGEREVNGEAYRRENDPYVKLIDHQVELAAGSETVSERVILPA